MGNQEKQHQAWWQKNKRSLIIAGVIIIVFLLVFSLAVYWFGWDWTGFTSGESKVTKTPQGTNTEYSPGKTLWDWMQLLIIPVVLGIGGFWLSQIQKSNEQKTATDNQRETALQGYIDKVADLLLKEHLAEKKPEYEMVREIARARTLTVLPPLDGNRKMSLLRFLTGAQLLGTIRLDDSDFSGLTLQDIVLSNFQLRLGDLTSIVLKDSKLDHFDLAYSDMSHATLSDSTLIYSDLSHVRLNYAKLTDMDLSHSIFVGAQFNGAKLIRVNLSHADLRSADLRETRLKEVNLKGATYNTKPIQMKDAQGEPVLKEGKPVYLKETQWTPEFDPTTVGAVCSDC